MNAVDTNILVRFLVNSPIEEDIKQRRIAKNTLEKVSYISLTVILETAWVLKGHYKFTSQEIAQAMTLLCEISHIHIENQIFLEQSLQHFVKGMDFADALHLAQANHCQQMVSFDKKFIAKSAKFQTLIPVVAPDD